MGHKICFRHLSETIKPSDLLGFNNTGNVCKFLHLIKKNCMSFISDVKMRNGNTFWILHFVDISAGNIRHFPLKMKCCNIYSPFCLFYQLLMYLQLKNNYHIKCNFVLKCVCGLFCFFQAFGHLKKWWHTTVFRTMTNLRKCSCSSLTIK